MFLSTTDDPIHVPQARNAIIVERLFWVFALSFCLDYRAESARDSAGIDQLLFLALALSSTTGILVLGIRFLLVRPGFWLIAGWGCFLVFMLMNAFAQGVPPGRSLRIILPLCLTYAGLLNTHIAGCMGLRPSRLVAPVLVAACTNIVWRLTHGILIKQVPLEEARTEVQSAANNWIAAFIGCSVLLRKRLHWTVFLAAGLLFTGVLVTVTRSLLLPIMASALASTVFFLLGVKWRIYKLTDGIRRLLPIATVGGLAALAMGTAALLKPSLLEKWDERLFHHIEGKNLSRDISITTREAEASAIFEILNRDKLHYINGHGIGSSYYWDDKFMPEIHQVFPENEGIGEDVWFAGHSTWTYALFSGGFIAVIAHLMLLGGVAILSLKSAKASASDPGPDQWLAFLPFVATCCLLSETATSNPFDERLAALIFGVMAAMPQAFFVRASWIHSSLQSQHE